MQQYISAKLALLPRENYERTSMMSKVAKTIANKTHLERKKLEILSQATAFMSGPQKKTKIYSDEGHLGFTKTALFEPFLCMF